MQESFTGWLNRSAVRDALRAWHHAPTLLNNPLQDTALVQHERQRTGQSPDEALRTVIRRAMDRLRPPDWHPDVLPRTPAARHYAILVEHFLQNKTLRALASAWHVDERTCRRDLTHAMDELAQLLQTEEHALLETTNARLSLSVELIPSLAAYSPLIGRQALLTQLLDALVADGRTVVLHGLPGVGKTALLVHLAHHDALRARFADGVLWAHLGDQPDLAYALRNWALALGLSAADIRELTTMNALEQVIHAQLLRRRMLIILDDAWRVTDAQALQLGGNTACYLIATRFPSVAIDLASPGQAFEVLGLTPEDSAQLLNAFAPQAVQAFPSEVTALIARYDGLPLLLSLAGRHLAHAYQRGHQARVQRELTRLLNTDSEEAAKVHVAFSQLLSASLNHLQAQDRQALYALTILPPKPTSFDDLTFQIVTGQAEPTLDALVDAGLLISEQTGYCLHGLIHDALSRDTSSEVASARRAGQARLLSYVMAHGAALFAPCADDSLAECSYPLPLASVHVALQSDDTSVLPQLAEWALPYLKRRGSLALADQLLDKATQTDIGSERWARLLAQRVDVLIYLGQIETARRQLITLRRWDDQQPPGCRAFIFEARARLALCAGRLRTTYALARRGWRCARQESVLPVEQLFELLQLQVNALNNMGCYADAARLNRQMLGLAARHHLADKQVHARYSLAVLERQLGEYAHALRHAKRALGQAKKQGDRYYTALALSLIGIIQNELGEHGQAMIAFAEAEAAAKILGLPRPLYQIRHAQGVLAMRRARWSEAEALLGEALAYAQRAGFQIAVANVQVELGECLLAQQKLDQSEQHLRAGLNLAEALGAADIAALLRYNLARVAQAHDQRELALALGQQAYHQLRSSGHYRADEVGRWLRTLPQG
jgi:tetratricopeptide (TPR) repeat protein